MSTVDARLTLHGFLKGLLPPAAMDWKTKVFEAAVDQSSSVRMKALKSMLARAENDGLTVIAEE